MSTGQDTTTTTLELPDGHRLRARVIADRDRKFVHGLGTSIALRELPRFPDRDHAAAADACVAPMPGKILAVLVALGDAIAEGQPLIVMEAMKMEHRIHAPHAGILRELRVEPGQQVDGGALLAIVDAGDPSTTRS